MNIDDYRESFWAYSEAFEKETNLSLSVIDEADFNNRNYNFLSYNYITDRKMIEKFLIDNAYTYEAKKRLEGGL